MKKYIKIVLILLVLFISFDLISQCPMCKMSVESNLKNGGNVGKGLNKGILYMLFAPYFIVGSIGYVWWRNKKVAQED
jgi:hypothetical protein